MRGVLALFLTSCIIPTTSSLPYPAWVEPYFKEAACRLGKAGINVRSTSPSDFFYIPHTSIKDVDGCGVYEEGGEFIYGHFSKPNYLHYASTCERVLIHEFGHAILYKIGDSSYYCWEHYGQKDEKKFKDCSLKYLKSSSCGGI